MFVALVTLPPAIAVGALVDPLAGLVVGALALIGAARPFEPVAALALLAATASFVNNEGGRLTRDLSVVSVVGLYTLACVLMAGARGRWRPMGGRFTAWVLAFMAWTWVCAVRGLLAGNPIRNVGLELAGLSTVGVAWLAGGLRVDARSLRPARTILLLTGLAHVGLGVWSYAVNHIRTGGIWYTPIPGMLAAFSLASALRAEDPRRRLGWTVLLGLFLLHQTISFSRGYWFGLLAALPATALVYAGRGAGARARWRRVAAVGALAATLAAVATIGTSLTYGWSDVAALIGTRFRSSFEMKNSSESASNVYRLLEYVASYRLIRSSPLVGHGMGLDLRIRNPLFHATSRQWYVHQAYLWLWLKQGLVGLLLLLVILWQGCWSGVRGARSPDPEAAVWGLTAAGATLFLAVVNLTTFHLAQVNSTTLQAVMWGFTLALSSPVTLKLVWRQRAPAAALQGAG